jgi:hypothetical protein
MNEENCTAQEAPLTLTVKSAIVEHPASVGIHALACNWEWVALPEQPD